MKILISKYQLDLLNKRNTASEAAIAAARTASLVAQQAQESAKQIRTALEDVASCIAAEAGHPPAEYAGMRFGEDDGKYFLDLIEHPKAE